MLLRLNLNVLLGKLINNNERLKEHNFISNTKNVHGYYDIIVLYTRILFLTVLKHRRIWSLIAFFSILQLVEQYVYARQG